MTAPIGLVVVPVATLLFILFAFHVGRNGGSVRAVYLFGLVLVSLVVALSALGGLAHAMGNAIADPRSGVPGCQEFQQRLQGSNDQAAVGFGTLAQGEIPTPPPLPTFPPFPSIPVPSFEAPNLQEILPSFEPIPVPSPFQLQEGMVQCPETSGRSGAGVEAIRSGILFVLAAGLGWANAIGARNELKREDRHGR